MILQSSWKISFVTLLRDLSGKDCYDETQRGLSGSILMECGVFVPAFLSYLKLGTVVNVTLCKPKALKSAFKLSANVLLTKLVDVYFTQQTHEN